MKARWFVETAAWTDRTNNDESNVHRIIWLLKELGLECHVDRYIPFGGADYNFFQDPGPVVFYGSLGGCRDVQKRHPFWKPFAWCDWDKLACHSYYAHYGKFILTPFYGMYPLGDIPRLKDELFKTYGDTVQGAGVGLPSTHYSVAGGDVIFIRPDDNYKSFNGELVSKYNFDRWYNMANCYEPGPTCLSVVSRPVPIVHEYRTVVADKRVIAASLYRENRQYTLSDKVNPNVLTFVETVLKSVDWQPAPIFVMDVAELPDGDLRLLEVGPINCAGLYQCDIRPVIEAMTRIAEREYEDAPKV